MSDTSLLADSPLLCWTGRHLKNKDHSVSFAWPLVQGSVVCQGTRFSITASGHSHTLRISTAWQHFDFPLHGNPETFTIALPPGKERIHWMSLQSEESTPTTIYHISVDDGMFFTTPHQTCARLLFVGDSWTTGYGNCCPGQCQGTAQEVHAHSDTTKSFPWLLFQALGLPAEVLALPGRGVLKNYDDCIPSVWPLSAYLDKAMPSVSAPVWAEAEHPQPPCQTICLLVGENDFSTSPTPTQAQFATALAQIAKQLLQEHPAAKLVLAASQQRPELAQAVEACASLLSSQSRVQLAILPALDPALPWGCSCHPGQQHHQQLAHNLRPFFGTLHT